MYGKTLKDLKKKFNNYKVNFTFYGWGRRTMWYLYLKRKGSILGTVKRLLKQPYEKLEIYVWYTDKEVRNMKSFNTMLKQS